MVSWTRHTTRSPAGTSGSCCAGTRTTGSASGVRSAGWSVGGSGPCLDAGCGTGAYAGLIGELGWTPVGADLSAGMLRYARRLPVVRADAGWLPFRDGALSAVVSVMVHTDDQEAVVIRPGYLDRHRTTASWTNQGLRDKVGASPLAAARAAARIFAGSGLTTMSCSGNLSLPAGERPLRLSDRTVGMRPLTPELMAALGTPVPVRAEPAPDRTHVVVAAVTAATTLALGAAVRLRRSAR
ncbi:class I SAM-dependent methyltransferase [Nonomuraea sp. KC401]|uniref:class I SAM-dependent methyltransferase n=1 Tax=unclassified Nonomuraea TaxID=2593643 RepID=UPI0010FF1269|nr:MULTISPECIES: class I SAM-dependent methyltransferase [unclassified Nonomuraea]NBE92733.1 methyltransferase domain-containing protein [Nonomuraea sp. K271]TLF60501.1 class I SAM-dependent methyltransferase [Nonomuraea sp. KC401]